MSVAFKLPVLEAQTPLPDRLESERLVLRRPRLADVEQMFRICGDPRTNVHNPAGPYPNIEKADMVLKAWLLHWRHKGFGQWAVQAREGGSHILGFGGLAVLNYGAEPRINLGFRFGPDAWGRGYATEMANEALRLAFNHLGFEEVYAKVRPANLASIAVLEKLGMRRDGELDDVPGQPPSLVYMRRRPVTG
jgi:RimJ/RimL family protein N-acetyltransferase